MGFQIGNKGFKIVYKENSTYKFIISRDVMFAETEFPSFLETKKEGSNKFFQLELYDFKIHIDASNSDQILVVHRHNGPQDQN